jgi:hypothetical protein
MSAVAEVVEVAEQIGVLLETGEDVERLAWYQRLEDAVLDLSSALPEGTEDYDARKLFEFLVAVRRAIAADLDGVDGRRRRAGDAEDGRCGPADRSPPRARSARRSASRCGSCV